MPEHKDLTGADLHEPKGVATASNKQIFIADGAGSGVWKDHSGSQHGEMIIMSNTVATVTPTAADSTLNTDSDYVKQVAGWSAGHEDGITFSVDKMIVSVDGDYEIHFWGDILYPSSNQLVGIKYAINDTAPYSVRKLLTNSASNGDILNVSGSGIITAMTAGDSLSIYIATDNNNDPTIVESGFLIKLLDDT